MINLMSPHAKKELRSARRNVILRSYTVYIFLAILAVITIYAGAFAITVREQLTAQNNLEEARDQTAAYADVREEGERFAANLEIARTILEDEIIYSTLITDIAKTLPSDTVLTSLTLNPDVFGAVTTLDARVHTPEAALQLKSTLEESPYFSNVNIASITESTGEAVGSDSSGPAYGVTLNLVIASPQEIETVQTNGGAS